VYFGLGSKYYEKFVFYAVELSWCSIAMFVTGRRHDHFLGATFAWWSRKKYLPSLLGLYNSNTFDHIFCPVAF